MSGCANCVWVEYAQTVAKILGDNDERAREIVLAKIKDPNLRMFLEIELRNLKQVRESRPEEPKKWHQLVQGIAQNCLSSIN